MNTEKQAAKKKNKKRMLIGIGIFCLIGVISWVLLENADRILRLPQKEITSMYSDKILSYCFYDPDYEADITQDEYYMGLDRYIHYQRGAENIAITDGNFAAYGEVIVFFADYFDAIMAGDAQRYNAMFTDVYYRSVEKYDRFAPQKIYDITLEQLRTEERNGNLVYYYEVRYAIYRNDGTFRNDVESDAIRPLIFELVTTADGIRINSITTYRTT